MDITVLKFTTVFCTTVFFLMGCGNTPKDPAQISVHPVLSLSGDTLVAPPLGPEREAAMQQDLDEARAQYELQPANADALIWLGRRTAYLWQYREAIDIFSEGIEKHPTDARLYRHRGHRYISVRDFEAAIKDLEQAALLIEGTEDEVEPDGQPNAAGIPTSTLHTNIWYHLGLAYYLKGDFEQALEAYEKCLAASANNDMRIATLDWLYMTLRRLEREQEAIEAIVPITEDLEILENHAYHRRILMYKGLIQPEALLSVDAVEDRALTLATQGYGVANWYLYNGQPDLAETLFEEILQGSYWAAFGYIAAEAELARGL